MESLFIDLDSEGACGVTEKSKLTKSTRESGMRLRDMNAKVNSLSFVNLRKDVYEKMSSY